jgi:hypothetical protein
MHPCRQECILNLFLSILPTGMHVRDRNAFLATGMRQCLAADRNARKQHLGLPRGAAGAIFTRSPGDR